MRTVTPGSEPKIVPWEKRLHCPDNEPDWLLEKRKQAIALMNKLPAPRVERLRIEHWPLLETHPEKATVDGNQEAWGQQWILPQAIQWKTPTTGPPSGLFDWGTACKERPEIMEKHAFSKNLGPHNQLAAIHQALHEGIAMLHIPRNQETKQPYQIFLHYGDNQLSSAYPYVLIVAEENTEASVFIVSSGGTAAHHCVVDVHLGTGARMKVATLNALRDETLGTFHRRAQLGRDSHLTWIVADASKGRVLSDTTSYLIGQGAHVNLQSLALGTGHSVFGTTALAEHLAQHTESHVHARVVSCDASTVVSNSITKIHKGAKKSNGQQTTRTLMLSPKARGDANPILLIDENDVLAGHAASVGKVDPMHLYYLKSRGIPQREAERLLIQGFLTGLFSEIDWPDLQTLFDQRLMKDFLS
ncbi:Fe-S cluster assembly protein SufD [Pasteuria penetrans]|uniref:Fe-S cluster assembly protein SufD n=1 Tax=Pasteuria penetrans TaxID=86005 RepID=UPI000FC01841|nr:Fe-S cluster assembly protein SufD [Pasteuria penetrans]